MASKRLADLLRPLGPTVVLGSVEREVSHVTRDSRLVRADSVFVAVVGATVDGHRFVPDLRCAAVVVDRETPVSDGVTVVRVEDTKRALALLSAELHDRPAEAVDVVGVTGTNGKTTVATLVEGALLHLGRRVARIGTTGNAVDGVVRPSSFTTPEAPQLQAFLAELRDEGVGTLVMEVSSIGLSQHRVDGIPFAMAAFTNLTQDHLDFHGDMASYAEAKARLFTELLRPAGGTPRALLCADDPGWRRMHPPADRWLYGQSEDADLRIEDAVLDGRGIRMRLRTPEGPVDVVSPMVGAHNAANLACAVGILMGRGLSAREAADAVGQVRGVPGRLEVVADPDRLVIVDYAHTPDALDHALRSVRELTGGRLSVVFGCGGDRDRDKRPTMGHLARTLADRIWVTSDNPRSEEPGAILADIVGGIGDLGPVVVEVDRARAIQGAIAELAPGDALLIAGKGHETYQEVAGQRTEFDDRRVARAALDAHPVRSG